MIINKIKVNKLKPIKEDFINKNKKYSAMGYCNNLKVKVYEVYDKNQGNLREFVSNHKDLSKYFPKLISFDHKFIVEEWVDGKTLKELNIKNFENLTYSLEIKKILNIMWSTKYKYQVFDYINHIHNRVEKKNNFNLSNVPLRINHNDLSLDNIILSSQGLKIIDNEFLGYNTGWILNIKNSFLKEDYEYQNFVSKKTLNQLWDLRKEWSKLNNKENEKKVTFYNFIKKFLLKYV